MSNIDDTAKSLLDALTPKQQPSAYDSTATVTRVENDTLWVHVPGGVEETPVKRTIGASEGDEIQIRVGGGQAWAVGNASAPPTDDTTANHAIAISSDALAVSEAARNAAAVAESSAISAVSSAERAAVAAATADEKAVEAQNSANTAATAASTAQTSADNAMTAATNATTAATTALTQLSTIEDVVGTLNWISEHGTYKATTDTEVVHGKLYFTRTGSGTEQDPYEYSVVTNPTGNPSTAGYFELDSVDEAVSNYVASHLALTDEGLYVINDQNGWRVLIKNDGVYIVDDNGTVVAQYKGDVTIGKIDSSYVRLTDKSFQMVDREDNVFFDVSDFRDENGEFTLTERFISNGTLLVYQLKYSINTLLRVAVDGTTLDSSDYTVGSRAITFVTAPQLDSEVVIRYKTSDSSFKAYTFGFRNIEYTYAVSDDTEVIPGKTYYTMASDLREIVYYDVATGDYVTRYENRTIYPKINNPTGNPHENGYLERNGFEIDSVGLLSVAEGDHTTARGKASHAEGSSTYANGNYSHAEGLGAQANGVYSHAEGQSTKSSGESSHAEGSETVASGKYSHSEGHQTRASGFASHAEGASGIGYFSQDYLVAAGNYSHAEGCITQANGDYSHAEGYKTIANGEAQHVFGSHNVEDLNDEYVEIVGNGTYIIDEQTPSASYWTYSNARTLDWDGNEVLAGNLTVNNNIRLYADGEGGNIRFLSKSGYVTEMDSYNDTQVRIISRNAADTAWYTLQWNREDNINLSTIKTQASNAVKKTGGTTDGMMTGRLYIKSSNITDKYQPSENTYGQAIEFVDSTSSNARLGYIQPVAYSDGGQGLLIGGYRDGIGNSLGLFRDKNGNQYVTLGQAAWQSALGITTTSGTYTPSIKWSSSGSPTVSSGVYQWIRSGNVIMIHGRFNITALNAPSTAGQLTISLPSGISVVNSVAAVGQLMTGYSHTVDFVGRVSSASGPIEFGSQAGSGISGAMQTGWHNFHVTVFVT